MKKIIFAALFLVVCDQIKAQIDSLITNEGRRYKVIHAIEITLSETSGRKELVDKIEVVDLGSTYIIINLSQKTEFQVTILQKPKKTEELPPTENDKILSPSIWKGQTDKGEKVEVTTLTSWGPQGEKSTLKNFEIKYLNGTKNTIYFFDYDFITL